MLVLLFYSCILRVFADVPYFTIILIAWSNLANMRHVKRCAPTVVDDIFDCDNFLLFADNGMLVLLVLFFTAMRTMGLMRGHTYQAVRLTSALSHVACFRIP